MRKIKKSLLTRIVGLLLEITGVLLLSLYAYTGVTSQPSSDVIYIPTQAENSSDYSFESEQNQIIEGQESSGLQGGYQNKSSKPSSGKTSSKQNSSKETSSKAVSSKRTSSKNSSQTSSKKTSSKNTSSKKTSSKQSSSKTSSDTSTSREVSSSPEASLPSSEPKSEPAFESRPESSEENDKENEEQALKNEEKAAEITKKYSVSVTIATPQSGITDENIEEYAKNPVEVKLGLTQIEETVKGFPKEFFEEATLDLGFILVGKTYSQGLVLTGKTIIVPCFKTISVSQLKSFIFNISSSQLCEEVSVDYSPFNPSSFMYGYIDEVYNYNAIRPEYSYFLSSKSQESQEEELYEIFMAFFEKPNFIMRIPRNTPLRPKLVYTAKMVVEWSPCFGEFEVIDSLIRLG